MLVKAVTALLLLFGVSVVYGQQKNSAREYFKEIREYYPANIYTDAARTKYSVQTNQWSAFGMDRYIKKNGNGLPLPFDYKQESDKGEYTAIPQTGGGPIFTYYTKLLKPDSLGPLFDEKSHEHEPNDPFLHSEFVARRVLQTNRIFPDQPISFDVPEAEVYFYSTMTPCFYACTRTTFSSPSGIASLLKNQYPNVAFHLAFDVHFYGNDDLQVWSSYTLYGKGLAHPWNRMREQYINTQRPGFVAVPFNDDYVINHYNQWNLYVLSTSVQDFVVKALTKTSFCKHCRMQSGPADDLFMGDLTATADDFPVIPTPNNGQQPAPPPTQADLADMVLRKRAIYYVIDYILWKIFDKKCGAIKDHENGACAHDLTRSGFLTPISFRKLSDWLEEIYKLLFPADPSMNEMPQSTKYEIEKFFKEQFSVLNWVSVKRAGEDEFRQVDLRINDRGELDPKWKTMPLAPPQKAESWYTLGTWKITCPGREGRLCENVASQAPTYSLDTIYRRFGRINFEYPLLEVNYHGGSWWSGKEDEQSFEQESALISRFLWYEFGRGGIYPPPRPGVYILYRNTNPDPKLEDGFGGMVYQIGYSTEDVYGDSSKAIQEVLRKKRLLLGRKYTITSLDEIPILPLYVKYLKSVICTETDPANGGYSTSDQCYIGAPPNPELKNPLRDAVDIMQFFNNNLRWRLWDEKGVQNDEGRTFDLYSLAKRMRGSLPNPLIKPYSDKPAEDLIC